jgi:molybdenum cofactor synthesis domain-containing protein
MAIRAAVLTVSDKGSAGERIDTAGPAVASILRENGIEVQETLVLPDERERIAAQLRRWAGEGLDLVLTTGGTGLSSRDVTPEATLDVAERSVPGIAEAMRQLGRASTPLASLSRSVAVTRGRTLIVNLPGSERGARESLEAVLDLFPHAVQMLGLYPVEEHPVAPSPDA